MPRGGLSGRTGGSGAGRTWARGAALLAVASLSIGAVVVGVQASQRAKAPAAPGHRTPGKLVSFSDAVRVDRRTGITATTPPTVAVRSTIPVTGVVVLPARPVRRPVRLEELAARRWHVVDQARSTRRGGFRLAVAAGRDTGSRTLRVVAPAYRRLASQHTRPSKVRVAAPTPTPTPTDPTDPTTTPTTAPTTPTDWDPAEYAGAHDPAPVGTARDWSWLMTATARWDPCSTIRWVYNPSGAYAGALDDVKRSVARVAGRTGLHFKYVGTSTYVPFSGNGSVPDGAEIAVGWSDEKHVSRLAGSVVGVGGGSMTYVTGRDVAGRMVRGEVLLDRGASLPHGFTTSGTATWGQVMEHEVMHAVGLGHAGGAEEVMAPEVSALNHFFGRGDLTGLARVGATSGCLP